MKITALMLQNFLNIKCINIQADGKNIVLSGANGVGKSAVLDGIQFVLTGKKPEDLIKHGEERSELIVETEEFIAKRVITQKTDTLTVKTKAGDVKSSPANFLQTIIGKLSFDPLEFSLMKPPAQRDLLKQLVGLTFDDIEKEYKETFDKRTGVNSQIKGVIAQLESAEAPHPDIPSDEILYKDEIEKLNVLREKRDVYQKAQDTKKYAEDGISAIEMRIRAHLHEIEEIKKYIKDAEISLGEQQAKLIQIVLPPETTAQQITNAESALQGIQDKNVKIRAANRYRTLAKDGNKLKQEADAFTENLKRLEQDKSTRISNAKMPIEGMSISDDSVIYRGIHFAQLSKGQKIRVSAAIGMALNPTLRVMFIRDGSLLDKAGMTEIEQLCKDWDGQLIVEKTDETGECGIYLEEGEVKAINGQEVKQPAPEAKS